MCRELCLCLQTKTARLLLIWKVLDDAILNICMIQVQYCAGKLLNTMISIIGPELQMDKARLQLILLICGELQEHADYQVRLAGLHGIQQLIMFAGKQVNLPTFIPLLQATLSSPNLQLRAAVHIFQV